MPPSLAPFSLRARLRSFRPAVAGLGVLVRETHNARIHLLATLVVAALALWLKVTPGEALALLLAVGLVWVAEALNSALEYLADATHPEPQEKIRKAKDVAAAGVLCAAITAALVGLTVFLPRLF